jgi:hypothetical protein
MPLTVLLVVALAFAPSALDQVPARTEPISADRVVLEVRVGGQAPAVIHVQNGQMARIQPTGQPAVGLVPVSKDGALTLVWLEILRDPVTGNEGLRQVSRQELPRATPVGVDVSGTRLEVSWLSTLLPATGATNEPTPCTDCCVTCGTVLFCGCVVITECGRCCCASVCECPWPQAPGATTGGCRPASATAIRRPASGNRR